MQTMKIHRGGELQNTIELDGLSHGDIAREREIQEADGYAVTVAYEADHEWGDLPDDIEPDDHAE